MSIWEEPNPPSGAAWREAVENTEDPFGRNFAAILGDEVDPLLNGEWQAGLGENPAPIEVAQALAKHGEELCSALLNQLIADQEEWLKRKAASKQGPA
jgi:hypothetical protein